MKYRIPQVEPFFDDKETAYVSSALENRWITEGPFAEKFLEAVKNLTGAPYAVLAPNGTLGLYLALVAGGITSGEVIVPDFTFNASASAVVFAGARPVFVDVRSSDLNIDPGRIEEAITPRTRAIMPVHVYGQSCDMAAITGIARKHHLQVVEDAAQSLGVFHDNRHTGLIGDVGVISFFADKVITTGEGGLVLTRHRDIHEKLTYLRNQGRMQSGTFVHPSLGLNFRMTDLQCAVGLAQMEKFPEIAAARLRNYELYQAFLKDIEQVRFLARNDFCNLVPFRVPLLVEEPGSLRDYLESRQIQTQRFFFPLHRQPCYQSAEAEEGRFRNSDHAYEKGLLLPVFSSLTEEQIGYVCSQVAAFYGGGVNP
ncbi:MAG: DegT/DnrJ/EryC1/StrS family aminotransferase [Desulfosudaceae bacterium]